MCHDFNFNIFNDDKTRFKTEIAQAIFNRNRTQLDAQLPQWARSVRPIRKDKNIKGKKKCDNIQFFKITNCKLGYECTTCIVYRLELNGFKLLSY